MNNFDSIAPFYDQLAEITFAGAIRKSQIHFFDRIQSGGSMLILGGGSGLVLAELDRLNLSMDIDFVEPSQRMVEKAINRTSDYSTLNINFHRMRFEHFHSDKKYDVVHCGFFLDLFPKVKLSITISKIRNLMGTDSILLVSDFRIDGGLRGIWQNMLSKVMHRFFISYADLESTELQKIQNQLNDSSLVLSKEKLFFSRFIFSSVYGLNKN